MWQCEQCSLSISLSISLSLSLSLFLSQRTPWRSWSGSPPLATSLPCARDCASCNLDNGTSSSISASISSDACVGCFYAFYISQVTCESLCPVCAHGDVFFLYAGHLIHRVVHPLGLWNFHVHTAIEELLLDDLSDAQDKVIRPNIVFQVFFKHAL